MHLPKSCAAVTSALPAFSPTSFTSLLTNLLYQPPHQPPLPASSPTSFTSLLPNLLPNHLLYPHLIYPISFLYSLLVLPLLSTIPLLPLSYWNPSCCPLASPHYSF